MAVHERNRTDGTVDTIELVQNGSPGRNGLYVSGYDDNAVALFSTRASVYLPLIVR